EPLHQPLLAQLLEAGDHGAIDEPLADAPAGRNLPDLHARALQWLEILPDHVAHVGDVLAADLVNGRRQRGAVFVVDLTQNFQSVVVLARSVKPDSRRDGGARHLARTLIGYVSVTEARGTKNIAGQLHAREPTPKSARRESADAPLTAQRGAANPARTWGTRY